MARREYIDVYRDPADPNCLPDALWVIASLEIVIRDDVTTGLILRLNSYPKAATEEGYWAPPNAQHRVKRDELPTGTEQTKAAFEHWERNVDNMKAVEASVESMAQSFGLRDFTIMPVRDERPLIEIKPSINDPDRVRAYYTLRYRLDAADNEVSRANLVDPEGRYGFVVLPLDRELDEVAPVRDDPNGTGEACRFFLGKPTMSGLNRLLERPNAQEQLKKLAIDVSGPSTSKELRGLIAVADVSGYGAVLQANLNAVLIAPNYARSQYRKAILSTLETSLVALGTTQVQSAGDGFVAGYPSVAPQDQSNLLRLAENWRRCAESIELNINGPLSLAETTTPPSVGSRMALSIGSYRWGRINGISSFYPAFEGGVVVSAARLEQGLNAAVNEGRVFMSTDGRNVPLRRRGHYLVLSSELGAQLGPDLEIPGWKSHGACVLLSKKEFEPRALLFEWIPDAP